MPRYTSDNGGRGKSESCATILDDEEGCFPLNVECFKGRIGSSSERKSSSSKRNENLDIKHAINLIDEFERLSKTSAKKNSQVKSVRGDANESSSSLLKRSAVKGVLDLIEEAQQEGGPDPDDNEVESRK